MHSMKKLDPENYEVLKIEEITYRLRNFGEPVKLFGEQKQDTFERLKKIESEMEVDDEIKANQNNEIKTTFTLIKKLNKDLSSDYRRTDFHSLEKSAKLSSNLISNSKSEASKCNIVCNSNFEDHCTKIIRKWCYQWKKHLLLRPTTIAESPQGRIAFQEYLSTVKAFKYLFKQLKKNLLREDVKIGIQLIVQAMEERNYLHADAILLNAIAIGNSPWPIGVTQVGIHTKSAAREKISTSHSNINAAAHIMGDEATRKYLHGIKRMLTVIQKLFPTDPSRSVEFNRDHDTSKVLKNLGVMKPGISEQCHDSNEIRPAPVRSLLQHDADGSVKVPIKLSQILKLSTD